MLRTLLLSLLAASVIAQETTTTATAAEPESSAVDTATETDQLFSIVSVAVPLESDTSTEPSTAISTIAPLTYTLVSATVPGGENVIEPTLSSTLYLSTSSSTAEDATLSRTTYVSFSSSVTDDATLSRTTYVSTSISIADSATESTTSTTVSGPVSSSTVSDVDANLNTISYSTSERTVTVTTTRTWTDWCGCPASVNHVSASLATGSALTSLHGMSGAFFTATYPSGSVLLPEDTVSATIAYPSATHTMSYSSGSVLLPDNTIYTFKTSVRSNSAIIDSATSNGVWGVWETWTFLTSTGTSSNVIGSATLTSISSTSTSSTSTSNNSTPSSSTSSATTSSVVTASATLTGTTSTSSTSSSSTSTTSSSTSSATTSSAVIGSATLTGTTSTSSTSLNSSSTSNTISNPTTSTSSTTTTSTSTSSSTSTTSSTSASTSTSTSTSPTTSTTTTTTSLSTTTATTTTSSITTTTTPSTTTTTTTSTTTTAGPVVTDEAYIDTILRHHNAHRSNSSANALTWSPSLADTARSIASTCVYQHNTTANGGGYGQNIGAGFPSNAMGSFVTEGLYNPEEPNYTAYGTEPVYGDVGRWGHFTQIVWKGTTQIGCYTYDCTATPGGLQGANGIPPYFTVCNYGPAGNVVGAFATNVGQPLGAASIDASYECGVRTNCVGPTT